MNHKIACLALLVLLHSNVATSDTNSGSGRVDRLIREGQEKILSGDYDAAEEVWLRLRKAAPNHPVAPVFEVSTLFWRTDDDEGDTTYDAPIRAKIAEAIEYGEELLEADPNDLDALIYLGHAYMQRGRIEGVRNAFITAGSAAKTSERYLGRALELAPEDVDIKFQLGLYNYYSSFISDRIQRWLGWLWFIPIGDRDTGLAYLNEVSDHGDIFRDEARFILSNIYIYHLPDNHLHRGLELVTKVYDRHPQNVLYHFELIEALMLVGDYNAAIKECLSLEARTPRQDFDRGRQLAARLWRARAMLLLGDDEGASPLLSSIGDSSPSQPFFFPIWIVLARGQLADLQGDREAALAYYEQVKGFEENMFNKRPMELAEQTVQSPFVAASVASGPLKARAHLQGASGAH